MQHKYTPYIWIISRLLSNFYLIIKQPAKLIPKIATQNKETANKNGITNYIEPNWDLF